VSNQKLMLKSSHLQRMCDYSNMGVLWHIHLNHLAEMSACLGQRYHHLDAISLLFRKLANR
jgi:hypothetical protein